MMRYFTIFLFINCVFAFVYSADTIQKVTDKKTLDVPPLNLNKDEEEVQDLSYEDYPEEEDIQPNFKENLQIPAVKEPQPSLKPKLTPSQATGKVNPSESIENYDEGADFDGDDYFGPSFEGIDSSELGRRGNPRWRNNGRDRGAARLPSRKPKAPRAQNGIRRRNGRKPTGRQGRLNRRGRNLQRNKRTNQRTRRG